MNYSIILYIIGYVLNIEGLFLLLPCVTALMYQERSGFSFLFTCILCLILGRLITRKKPKNTVFYGKEGFVTVSLCWIILSIFGALPFVLNGEIPYIPDALFETISGFTTTGSTILTDIEVLSKCALMWRSFTHWIGGMGVLVFVLAVLPISGSGSHMYLMRAESPGPSVNKLVPRVKHTAMILYGIYIVITLVEILLLLIGGMPLFDAITSAFGTVGTGGFGVKNDSFASYSPFCQSVVTVFMILCGINFNVYYLILCKKHKQAFQSEELRMYLGVILISTMLIAINIRHLFPGFQAIRHALFQVGSIITTTGFATTDFNTWPDLSKMILIFLMFFGACAGSTGGGIKISRILILIKSIKKELFFIVHPRSVKKLRMDGQAIEHDVVRSVNVFLAVYLLIMMFSILIVSLENKGTVTTVTSVITTMNNIGPGLDIVGPVGNFSSFSALSKFVFMFDMLAGRLEIFPMLILFMPDTWKK
ncbi:MAG: TrkH family potassium uptake protein [Lachnospiraceae bacterium]|nr:TrkH family potassium uptake protein [Lachnospiraceae bacterium]